MKDYGGVLLVCYRPFFVYRKQVRRCYNMTMEIEKEIKAIKERNKRVETDKAWETSWTRRICICVLTYIVVVCYQWLISKNSNIWLSSIVPVIGFTLSTLSLKLVRKIWEKNRK